MADLSLADVFQPITLKMMGKDYRLKSPNRSLEAHSDARLEVRQAAPRASLLVN